MKQFLINTYAKFAMVLAFGAFLTIAAPAQELSPDHLALARKYVDLTDHAQLFETTLIQTGINSMRTIVSQNPEISEEVSTAIGEVIKFYAPQKDELFDQFARIYALRFTVDELRQIVAFYESEVGTKLSAANATTNNELSAVLQIYQVNLNTEFFAKVRAELRAKGIDT
jgi:hypothetical protein